MLMRITTTVDNSPAMIVPEVPIITLIKEECDLPKSSWMC